MNQFEMVVLIVAIVMITSVFKSRYRHRTLQREDHEQDLAAPSAENNQLRQEVQTLKQRIQVLERIAVEKENSLTREIEELRDR